MKRNLIRIIAILLMLTLVVTSLGACQAPSEDGNGDYETPDAPSEDNESTDGGNEGDNGNGDNVDGNKKHALDGKKVLFIGNSHTYYGKTVLEKTQSVLTQEARSNDKGYFYQICKNNGAEVSVTNWTFGNHNFDDLFVNCDADRGCNGTKHADYLTDRNFDYVILQQGTGNYSAEELHASIARVTEVFKAANPDVKFIFAVSRRAHEKGLQWLSERKVLAEQGFIIVDWGDLVDDVITGEVSVPGATQSYNQNSFIIRKSASDGYHPNMLTGYITSLMVYCAITGESAVGQGYGFCGDKSVYSGFNFSYFISKYYTYDGATTNFTEIFASEADMAGIQSLIDKYLLEKPYID